MNMSTPSSPAPQSAIRILSMIGVVVFAGCKNNERMQSVLHPMGNDASVISGMAWLLFGGGGIIFIGVMLLLGMSLRTGRRVVHPAVWLIGAGIVFPVVVLTSLLIYSVTRSQQLIPPMSQNALVISVTAKLWWWEVRYRDDASGKDITLANEIHLPVGRPVYLSLTSDDVIHSFWVPALAGKIDMLPGRITRLRVTATEAGVLRGQCAEYCGEQHARMALHVVAESPEQFDAWLTGQTKLAALPSNAFLERGRDIFIQQRCAACHTIRGVSEETIAGQTLGPDLTHVGSRLFLGAGVMKNDRDALGNWIAHTQKIKPGARMPSFGHIDEEAMYALSSYLEQLK